MTMESNAAHTPASGRRVAGALPARFLLVALPLVVAVWVHAAAATSQPPNLAAAIEAQRQRIAQNPTSVGAYNDLGNLLVLGDDREGAEAAYREALRLDPDSASALFNLAVLLRSIHRPGEAIEALDRAIELDPLSAWAHYQRGAAYQDLGNRRRATRDYGRAFAIDSRLALDDINPHVIGNSLVIAALLQPRGDVPVSDTTPRSYADPGPITRILVPPTAAVQAPPPAEAGASSTDGIAPAAGEAGSGLRPLSTWSSEEPGEIEAAGSAEPAPAGDPSAQEREAVGGTRRITNDDLRSLRIINQPAPESATPEPPRGGTRTQPDSTTAPERFRPGRRSSAQLDLRLAPEMGGEDRRGPTPAFTLARR